MWTVRRSLQCDFTSDFNRTWEFLIIWQIFTDEESAKKVHTLPVICLDVRALANIVPRSLETANRTS